MKYHCLKNIFRKRRKYSLVHKHNIGQPTFSTFLKRAPPPPKTALGLHSLQIQTQAQELDFYFLQAKSLTFWKIECRSIEKR